MIVQVIAQAQLRRETVESSLCAKAALALPKAGDLLRAPQAKIFERVRIILRNYSLSIP